MMKTTEMKKVLLNKLHDENCNFKLSDIHIRKVKEDHYEIQIEDYTPYRMRLFNDELFGKKDFTVMIIDNVFGSTVAFTTSSKDYDIENALIDLGYWAGNTL